MVVWKFLVSAILFLSASGYSCASPVSGPADYYSPTGVAPAFFGPNAFPVPDMLAEGTSSDFRLEVFADSFFGNAVKDVDYTSDLFLRLTVPCFTPRVNIVMWGVPSEYCRSGNLANDFRGIRYDGELRDCYAGDFYISADVLVLSREKCGVDLTARMALKTASGHRFHYARFYDSPGYFFDASLGRDFRLGGGGVRARLALSTGFLCWQTDVRRQNDAMMYGAYASLAAGRFELSAEYGGYVGWEKYGDAPMTLKTSLSCGFGNFTIKLQHQLGFVDWPYNQIRFGAEYRFNFRRK